MPRLRHSWYYEFDANGNQIRQVPNGLTPTAGELRYTFNQRNLLVQIETHDGTTYQIQTTALYDGHGYRRQTEAFIVGIPLTNTYALDVLRNGLPLTMQDNLTTTHILYGLYGIGEYQGETWQYYLGDAQLTVRQLSNADSQITLARTYTPLPELFSLPTISLWAVNGKDGCAN